MLLRVHSPYDDSLVTELPYDDDDSALAKLAAVTAAQRIWRLVPVAERVARVRAAVDWFTANAGEVALDVTRQMGKPFDQAQGEVRGLVERAEYMLGIAERSLAPETLPAKEGLTRRIEHVPLGVVLDVAAWNYPLMIAVNLVVPAVLAGNGVLLKHSARTPLCGLHFERAFRAAGLDDLVVSLVLDHDTTARLIADPRVAHVAFTGSVEGGRQVHRAASERFIDTGLELGGNDPAYVAADADVAMAAAGVVDGACYNAGQSCCAVERVYVHESVADEFLDHARELVGAYRAGDPLSAQTTLGPLASKAALAGLTSQVAEAGADVLVGGGAIDDRFFEATLLLGAGPDAAVMREESFGPLVPVARVASDDEALALMNDSRYGLTASIWTADAGRADWFAARHDAGTIYRNRCDVLDPALPWTGFRDSGKGSTLSHHGFLHLTKRKAIHFRD